MPAKSRWDLIQGLKDYSIVLSDSRSLSGI